MGILVQNLIKRGCITIKENANIYELIETLNKNSIGCVVVISEEKKNLVGIISERDLIMRGGGEILGKNQYGFENFRFFDISRHQKLLKMATAEAYEILNSDPCLESARGKSLIELLYLFEKNKAIDFISAG